MKDTHIVEKVSILDSRTWKPAVVMKRCGEPISFIVKTENGKTFRRKRQHLHHIAYSNGTDDNILISDDEEENYVEKEVTVKREGVEIDPCDEVNVPHPDKLSNEVITRSG